MSPRDEYDALQSLVSSEGWKLVQNRAAFVQSCALKANLSADGMQEVGFNNGRHKGAEELAAWPEYRLKMLSVELDKV